MPMSFFISQTIETERSAGGKFATGSPDLHSQPYNTTPDKESGPRARLHMPLMLVLYLALMELLWLRARLTYVCSMGLSTLLVHAVIDRPLQQYVRGRYRRATVFMSTILMVHTYHTPPTDPAPGAWGVSIQVSTSEPYLHIPPPFSGSIVATKDCTASCLP